MKIVALGLMVLPISTGAFAQSNSPLPPGKPAGIRQAELHTAEDNILIGMIALGAVATAILMASASKGSTTNAATTTSAAP